LTSFHDFGLAEPITRALAEEKYATPTPIQAQTIPVVMARRDAIASVLTAATSAPVLRW
jgi:ATP-dependent RNA helicase RhlE